MLVCSLALKELNQRKENISEVILAEEKGFITTLNSSDTIFKEKFREVFDRPDPKEAGRIAFRLYDTYGLPFEITKDWLTKHNVKISEGVFVGELNQQKTVKIARPRPAQACQTINKIRRLDH